MKITIKELKSLIAEEVDAFLDETAGDMPSWETDVVTHVIGIMADHGFHRGRPSLFLGGFFAREPLQKMIEHFGLSEEQLMQMAFKGSRLPSVSENLEEAAEGEEVLQALGDVDKDAKQIADKVKREIEALELPAGMDSKMLAGAVAALLTAD